MSKITYFAIGTFVGYLQSFVVLSISKHHSMLLAFLASLLTYELCKQITVFFDSKLSKDKQKAKDNHND